MTPSGSSPAWSHTGPDSNRFEGDLRTGGHWGPSLLLGALVLLVYSAFFLWPTLWRLCLWDVVHDMKYYPFHDMRGHLASCEAYARGLDIIGHPNPLDLAHRAHVGTSWMLYGGFLGLKASHYVPAAILSILLFFATTVLLWKPRHYRDVWIPLVLLCNPIAAMGVHQANVDLFVFFLLVSVAALLALDKSLARLCAWVLIAAFIGFKLYPTMAFALFFVCPMPRRERLYYLGASLTATLAYLACFWGELRQVQSMSVSNTYLSWYGAGRLLALGGMPEASLFIPSLIGFAAISVGVAVLLGAPTADEGRSGFGTLAFTLGAGVVCFCFGVTTNAEYKLIFLIPCGPYLLELYRGGSVRFKWSVVLILALLGLMSWLELLLCRNFAYFSNPQGHVQLVFLKQLGNWIATSLLCALWLRILWLHLRVLLSPGLPAGSSQLP